MTFVPRCIDQVGAWGHLARPCCSCNDKMPADDFKTPYGEQYLLEAIPKSGKKGLKIPDFGKGIWTPEKILVALIMLLRTCL